MTAPTAPSARSVGFRPVLRGRGRPDTVTVRRTLYAEGLAEGMALAGEVIEGATRIQALAATGSRQVVVHEAGRLGVKATAAMVELRRLAAGVDE